MSDTPELPTAEAQAASVAAAAADTAGNIAAAPVTPAEPEKSAATQERDRIYAKAAERRAQEGDASMQAMREGVRQMIEGEPAPETAPANNPAPPLAQTQDMVTIKVEGRETQVTRADVERAGIATLQKETAADVKLRRAVLVDQQLQLERQRLDQREAEINARPPAQGAAPTSTTRDPPSGGQAENDVIEKALEALLDSDTKGAAKALKGFVAEQVELGVKSSRAPAPAVDSPPMAAGAVPDPWSKDEKDRTNQLFADAFPELLNDPLLGPRATARILHEMADPMNRIGKVPLATLAVRIGLEMSQAATPSAPNPSPSANSVDELAARRTLAARVPGVPALAQTRSVTPASEPRPQTNAEKVQQMRKSRGQETFA